MSTATTFFKALSNLLEIEAPGEEDDELFFSRDGKTFALRWLPNLQCFAIYAEVGYLAGWRDGEVCRQLLAANFLLAETNGAALSLNTNNASVGLNWRLPAYGLEVEAFIDAVDQAAVQADVWFERLQAMCAEQEAIVESELDRLGQEDGDDGEEDVGEAAKAGKAIISQAFLRV
jgi:hypothetical protein